VQATVYQKGPLSRILYVLPGGKQRIVLDDGKHLYELDATTKTAIKASPTREPSRIETLLANYDVTITGKATVAGRECDVISVRSKRAGSPSRKVWVDRETALILRSDSHDASGRLTAQTVYSSVDYQAKLAPDLFRVPQGWTVREVASDTTRHYTRDEISRRVGFRVPAPTYMPRGFVFDGYHLSQCSGGVPYCLARYVDGLASVSIISRHEVCPQCGRTATGSGAQGRGQQHRYGQGKGRGLCGSPMRTSANAAVVTKDGVTSLVLGDLPKSELDRIAAGLK
jgi:negative regulator of sigma E activity